jgi:hypothetical protein
MNPIKRCHFLGISSKMHGDSLDGALPFVAGWGSTRFQAPASAELLETRLKVK